MIYERIRCAMNDYTDSGFLFSYIRFMNFSPQGGSADFYIGNTLVCAGIKYGSYSPYIKTSSGPQVYKATRCGKKDEIIDKITLCQNVGHVDNLCLCGKADNAVFFVVNEPKENPDKDYGNLRICNLSIDTDNLNIWANDEMIIGDIEYKNISRYLKIKPQNYEIKITGKEKDFISLGNYQLNADKYNTIYITGIKNEMPHLSGILTLDAASYDGFYLL